MCKGFACESNMLHPTCSNACECNIQGEVGAFPIVAAHTQAHPRKGQLEAYT